MPKRPFIVLADDLTGAAEIAAIVRQSGRRGIILTQPTVSPVEADVLILNTDTRLLTPAMAARRVRAWITRLLQAQPRHRGVFLKFDSVLRGPVLAQVGTAVRALGMSRAILVPANPSLGRVIRAGRYFIHGRLLHETAFAKDPHHPRNTSEVLALLGRAPRVSRTCLPATSPDLPAQGVILGEATCSADMRRWRDRLSSDTLPAGGADFFRAWLGTCVPAKVPSSAPCLFGPALVLHGTTASSADDGALAFRGVRAPASAKVIERLARNGSACVAAPERRLESDGSSAAISIAFSKLAAELLRKGAFKHLLIAGGATASAVLSILRWTELDVVHVWAPGVVTLKPLAEPAFVVTLKPGSYPWPDVLRSLLPGRLLP